MYRYASSTTSRKRARILIATLYNLKNLRYYAIFVNWHAILVCEFVNELVAEIVCELSQYRPYFLRHLRYRMRDLAVFGLKG